MTNTIDRRTFITTGTASAFVAGATLMGFADEAPRKLKPIIKYRGGKSKELSQYIRFIPNDFDTYYEPFLGGGATFFHVAPQKAVIGDINEPLIDFYQDVRNRFDDLSQELAGLQEVYEANQRAYLQKKAKNLEEHIPNANEALYYKLRDQFNGLSKREYSRAALYFFINKTAYSGMIRYNANGHFNVPFGRYAHFNTKLITREHSQLLQQADILNADYSVSFERAGKNDFMYLDPPYDCVFNDYGNLELSNGFDEGEHRRLAELFRNLKCRALMIISHTPLTQELYGDLVRYEYAKDYSVNIRNRFHSQATHYVVTNYKV
jgi:DNA adenine methylase